MLGNGFNYLTIRINYFSSPDKKKLNFKINFLTKREGWDFEKDVSNQNLKRHLQVRDLHF